MLGLTTVAAAQTASSPGEVRIALTDQRFALDRLAADQPQGDATFLVDDAPTIEVDLAATVDGLVTRIEAPSGAVIDAGHLPAGGDFGVFGPGSGGPSDSPFIVPVDGPEFHTIYRFPSAGPGTYRVVFESPGLAGEAAVVTRFATTSPVVAALFAPAPEVVLGNPVVLTAALFGGGQPIAGATVRVSVNDRAGQFTDVTLRDDGVGSDTAAGDGLYSGDLVPTAPGRYAAFAILEGAAGGGRPFARQAATTFQVVRPTGILQGRFNDDGVDDNADQLIDRVRVTPALDVQEPGLYRLMATLRTASGRMLVRAGEATLPVGLGGSTSISRRMRSVPSAKTVPTRSLRSISISSAQTARCGPTPSPRWGSPAPMRSAICNGRPWPSPVGSRRSPSTTTATAASIACTWAWRST